MEPEMYLTIAIILLELIIVGAILTSVLFLVLLKVGLVPMPDESEWLGRFVTRREPRNRIWRVTAGAKMVPTMGGSETKAVVVIFGLLALAIAVVVSKEQERLQAGNEYGKIEVEYEQYSPLRGSRGLLAAAVQNFLIEPMPE